MLTPGDAGSRGWWKRGQGSVLPAEKVPSLTSPCLVCAAVCWPRGIATPIARMRPGGEGLVQGARLSSAPSHGVSVCP